MIDSCETDTKLNFKLQSPKPFQIDLDNIFPSELHVGLKKQGKSHNYGSHSSLEC